MMKFYSILVINIALLIGCTSLPQERVWRPWTNVQNSTENMELGKSFSLSGSWDLPFLAGYKDLFIENVKKDFVRILERRGFKNKKDNADYNVAVTVKSWTAQKTSATNININSSYISSQTQAALVSDYGVRIAAAVSNATRYSGSSFTAMQTETYTYYTYSMSIEIRKYDKTIWEGNSYWESPRLSPAEQILHAYKILCSNLPFDENSEPHVEAVKDTHVMNYYRLVFENKYFSCPALPYPLIVQQNSNLNNSM